jgi:hypothetical protein
MLSCGIVVIAAVKSESIIGPKTGVTGSVAALAARPFPPTVNGPTRLLTGAIGVVWVTAVVELYPTIKPKISAPVCATIGTHVTVTN